MVSFRAEIETQAGYQQVRKTPPRTPNNLVMCVARIDGHYSGRRFIMEYRGHVERAWPLSVASRDGPIPGLVVDLAGGLSKHERDVLLGTI